ncbi:AAA family ATPase [Candidatus Methylacidithermus pantelleriae]|uniref:ATP-dependent protease Clp, ATPase subunit n=1 Tax=Candidatus Methylacidithermus pantelleriae TaxID=2744239 RepID=A0A8J2FTL3_9BACT|nr:AAA family ATPase [Candidatus Methylacidithermus pantelleriae]CAF0705283.1 ATP-dependent protease Clp, ATPase subunit [Candidatus Methylacidithermus pantelleriae]
MEGTPPPLNPEEFQRRFQEFLRGPFLFPWARGAESARQQEPSKAKEKVLQFSLTPKQVKAYLDRFVIKQEEAKKVLSVAVCDHYNFIRSAVEGRPQPNYVKQNVLLIGPTGVGKTYLVRCIAQLIGVPMVHADATKFSETGYVGADVEDLVRQLVQEANGDVELAQYGIIYLDEVDKLATPLGVLGRDVSGRGVQANLLKLMEETEVPLRAAYDVQGQIQALLELQQGKPLQKTINTRYILFVVSGAFEKLTEIVARRLSKAQVGFQPRTPTQTPRWEDLWEEATTEDFIEYGLEPEFVGRLPVRVACSPLDEEDLFRILRDSEGSILKQYEASLRAYGIETEFTEAALRAIARKASGEKTGARGLMTILERILRPLKFELPGAGQGRLLIDQDFVEDPRGGLPRILDRWQQEQARNRAQELEEFAASFAQQHGLSLEFSPQAVDRLLAEASLEAGAVRRLCEEKFRDFEYGLKLIQKSTGRTRFTISEEAVLDPQGVLNRWVADACGGTTPDESSA